MIHIEKDSTSIGSLVGTRDDEDWSGQRWDDGDIETVRYFKESGVFLTDEEVSKIGEWLTDYAEKKDERTAREVREFLLRMQPI